MGRRQNTGEGSCEDMGRMKGRKKKGKTEKGYREGVDKGEGKNGIL